MVGKEIHDRFISKTKEYIFLIYINYFKFALNDIDKADIKNVIA